MNLIEHKTEKFCERRSFHMNNQYKKILSEISALGIAEDDIKEEMTLVDDLAFDSLTFVQMVLMLENAYNIKFDDEYINIEKLKTVKAVADYLVTKTGDQ